jgi:DNA-binding NarL/FixJ family response regulator
VELAVLDPLPLFRIGVVAALGRGTALASTAEIDTWLEPRRDAVLVLTVPTVSDDDSGWATLALLHQYPQVRTIAVLTPFTVISAGRALRSGAVHVAARDTGASALRRVIKEVEKGVIRLPLEVLRAATSPQQSGRMRYEISDDELGWLRALSAGNTVEAVAGESGLSERMLYRRLHHLYQRLGAANRTQALILSRDEGWI